MIISSPVFCSLAIWLVIHLPDASNSCFIELTPSISSQSQGTRCTQSDFMEDVAAKISTSWYHFGICLDIEVGKLDEIEQKYPRDQLRCFSAVYSIWKNERLKPLTWEEVIQILRKNIMAQSALSLSLAEKYSVKI